MFLIITASQGGDVQVQVIGEIVSSLLKAVQDGKDVDLNKLKNGIASKYGVPSAPRLVDIIAAVPSQHKALLLPRLKAKPVRTASGVSVNITKHSLIYMNEYF